LHQPFGPSPSPLLQRERPRIGAAWVTTVLSVLLATRRTVKARIA
tara:strand:- start:536 stop:670 length:135 start_codon:yes stop_codon:yes gene_type:complete